MDKKLTFSLNNEIIETPKIYAKSHNMSLSKLIESYRSTLTTKEEKDNKITPLVKSLSGVISLDDDFDLKEDYAQFLIEKYK
jgi:hypothetical protein